MAIKMDKTTIIPCAVVGSLGLLSAILGFSAEGTKLTPYTILVYGDECIYPQNPALGLGICAVIFLVVSQVTISAVGGCCGCCKSRSMPSETKRIVGIVCAVFSWIAAVIAWALLIEGASWNANVVREAAPFCPYLKDGIFAGGGVLALAATALGLTSFIMMRRPAAPSKPAAGDHQSTSNDDAVMGHPVLPTATSEVQHPPKTQAYVQEEENQKNQQAPPLPPPAAAQNDGSQAASQQIPPQGLPAATALAAASVACAPQGPGEQPPLPQVCPEITMTPAPGPAQGNGVSTIIRNELVKATIKLAGKAVEHAVFANHAATSALSPMVTDDDTTGGDVGATDNGVVVV